MKFCYTAEERKHAKTEIIMNSYDTLNEVQKKAVFYTEGPLLILAGAVNGLILPITLGICLIAAKNKKIMGDDYKHPTVLLVLGVIVVVISAYLGITTFMSNMGSLLG